MTSILPLELPRDRDSFFKEVSKFSANDTDPKAPLLFLCQYLLGDPDAYLNRKKSEPVSLPEAWVRRFYDLRLNDLGIWTFWWKQEIEKPNYWPELEKLFKYVDQRGDI